MAASGLRVGVVDADVYGFSVPRMLGVSGRPTQVDDMILPPLAHDVKVISIGMFVPGNQPVVWRGPMLHRALQQFLGDVFWGDLDVLLLDLPPGTGDIAISVAQLIPNAEILVVTTPQQAAGRGGRAGRRDCPPDPPAARRRRREHVVAGACGRLSPGDLRVRRRPDRGRLADPASGAPVPLLGQIPAGHAAGRAATRGCPWCSATPTRQRPWRFVRWRADSRRERVAWPDGRWVSPPPAADRSRGAPAHDDARTVGDVDGRRPSGVVKPPRSCRPPASMYTFEGVRWRRRPRGSVWPGRGTARSTKRHDAGLRLVGLVRRLVRCRVVHQRLTHDPARVVLARVELAPVDVLELRTHLVLELGPGVRQPGCGPAGPWRRACPRTPAGAPARARGCRRRRA